jgi:hypothetical protein
MPPESTLAPRRYRFEDLEVEGVSRRMVRSFSLSAPVCASATEPARTFFLRDSLVELSTMDRDRRRRDDAEPHLKAGNLEKGYGRATGTTCWPTQRGVSRQPSKG